MAEHCTACKEHVGHFNLRDTICDMCIASKGINAKGKTARIFSFSPFWGVVFVLGFALHFLIMANNPTAEQAVVSSVLMVFSLASFITAFVVRFFLCRRRLHLALALALSFPFAIFILVVSGMTGPSPASLTTLGFVLFPFFILRLPNLSLESDDHQFKKQEVLEPAVNGKTALWVFIGFIAAILVLAMAFPQ